MRTDFPRYSRALKRALTFWSTTPTRAETMKVTGGEANSNNHTLLLTVDLPPCDCVIAPLLGDSAPCLPRHD